MTGTMLVLLWMGEALAAGDAEANRAKAEALAAKAAAAWDQGKRKNASKLASRSLELHESALALEIHLLAEASVLETRAQTIPLLLSADPSFDPQAIIESMLQDFQTKLARLEALKPDSVALSVGKHVLSGLRGPGLLPVLDADCPAEATQHFDTAERAFAASDYGAALKSYDDALAVCPAQATWWTWSGDAVLMTEGPRAALSRYRQAIEIDPCHHVAHRFLTDVTFRLEDMNDAELRQAIQSATSSVACNPTYQPGWSTLRAMLDMAGIDHTGLDLRVLDPEGVEALLVAARTRPEPTVSERRAAAFRALLAEGGHQGALFQVVASVVDQEALPAILAWETMDAEVEAEFRELRLTHLEALRAWVLASRAPRGGLLGR